MDVTEIPFHGVIRLLDTPICIISQSFHFVKEKTFVNSSGRRSGESEWWVVKNCGCK